jgi:hypothetical protein
LFAEFHFIKPEKPVSRKDAKAPRRNKSNPDLIQRIPFSNPPTFGIRFKKNRGACKALLPHEYAPHCTHDLLCAFAPLRETFIN